MAATVVPNIPIKVWKDSEVVYMPLWKDVNDNPIQNSASMPYPKPIIEPVSVGIIHCELYKSGYTDDDYATELNAVNLAAWRGFEAECAWVSRIIVEPDLSASSGDVVKLHYIVRCCEHGWQLQIPDFGYVYDDSGLKAFTADGVPYIGKLDQSGGVETGDMLINKHETKRKIAFSSLGF